jgi:large subunit ribosomal protein L4
MSTQTFTSTGVKSSVAAKLSKDVFDVEVKNHDLLKSAYVAYLANGRENLAKTKNRGDVSGGGKKPWRQKGTGRARFGSSRVPIWRGGGVAMGPTGNENYSHNISIRMKRTALRQALSLKNQADSLIVIEKFEAKEAKTKNVTELLGKLGATRRTLLVCDTIDDSIRRATSNIADLKVVRTRSANAYDVMNADKVIITSAAVDEMTEWLIGGSK